MTKKGLIILMTIGMVYAMSSIAFAVQESGTPPGAKGEIIPNQYSLSYKDWYDKIQGKNIVYYGPYPGAISTHPYGTWNSPYTWGVDGYSYNDSQDYTADGTQVDKGKKPGDTLDTDPTNNIFVSGPHGGYLTSTHRCRECHAVHRAAGKFKLLRSDTRFEACDWCHGTGAGSGFNIQMDSDDAYTTEYNTGHTMGFGIQSGKWKAPDDTYPAFTPNYWMGGFSCFDCHSPHANPQRLLGFTDSGQSYGLIVTQTGINKGKVLSIINPGHGTITDGDAAADAPSYCIECHINETLTKPRNPLPLYQAGSWLLVKNPDREIATATDTGVPYYDVDQGALVTTDIANGTEISDMIYASSAVVNGQTEVTGGQLHQFDNNTTYPVNKVPIDWNIPIGIAIKNDPTTGFDHRSTTKQYWQVSEFCTDCHDGNAGLHTIAAPLFSEDRALRDQQPQSGTDTVTWKGEYDLAYGHDAQPRHCARQMQFNPEDGSDFGPHCRNCHRGSSDCGFCHGNTYIWPTTITDAANNNYVSDPQLVTLMGATTYNPRATSDRYVEGASPIDNANNIASVLHTDITGVYWEYPTGMFKKSRTIRWDPSWRSGSSAVNPGQVFGSCSNDGFSWPHRTLGWKLLKDDLFGLNFDGTPVGIGETRAYFDGMTTTTWVAHDLDSVCLDCHNPTVWRATSSSHTDTAGTTTDDFNDELLLRGLP